MARTLARLPTEAGHPLFGVVPALRRDILTLLAGAHERHGDVVRLRAPGLPPLVSLAHPRAARHIFVEAADRYGRSPFHARLRPVLGAGLLTSEPPLWTTQRRLLQPAFQARALRRYVALMCAESERFAAAWAHAPEGVIDANLAASDLTLAIVVRALFGRDAPRDDIAAAVDELRRFMAARVFQPLPLPLALPLPAHRRFRRARALIEVQIERLLAQGGDSDAAAIACLAAVPTMPARQIRDEVVTLFLAGHETSAGALAWAWFLLGERADLQKRLAAEAAALGDDADLDGDPGDALPLARAVAMETLRLYPPAAWLARTLRADDTVDGLRLRAGTVVMVSPFVIQRDARWWPEPERFAPERFAAGASKPEPQSYLPFGAGPRTCIGLQFALWQLTLAIAALSRVARYRCMAPERVIAHSAITLRPAPSLHLSVTPRSLTPP